MKLRFVLASLGLVWCVSTTAGLIDTLNEAERSSIQKGLQVVRTEDVEGSAWPKIFVFQIIEATPEEVAAVFCDFERHKDMFDRVKKSTIVKRMDARTFELDYTLGLGGIPGNVLPDENYTTRDVINFDIAGLSYRVDWTMLKSDSVQNVEGALAVEPYVNGSIVSYYSFIVPPKPQLAAIIKKIAIKQVKDSVMAIGKQVASEKINDPVLLSLQVENLRSALQQ